MKVERESMRDWNLGDATVIRGRLQAKRSKHASRPKITEDFRIVVAGLHSILASKSVSLNIYAKHQSTCAFARPLIA